MRLAQVLSTLVLGGCIIQPAPAAPYSPGPPPPSPTPGDPLVQTQQQEQQTTQQRATDAVATSDAYDQPPARPMKLRKLAPYQLEWMHMLPSYIFTSTGAELLYVDAGRGALMAVPSAGGKPRDVYVGKVGHVHWELEGGDALVLVDEKYSSPGNEYNEHYRRVVVSSGASSEIGRDMPADVRMVQDSARFRAAGVEGVQPFRVGNLLAGQTPTKDLVVLEQGKVVTVCKSPGANVAWPHALGDGRRLAQPANEHLLVADVAAHSCVRTDEHLPPSTFIYPILAGTDDGKWLLYPASGPSANGSSQRDMALYLADASGHAKLVTTLPGAIGVRPIALPRSHTFIYAASWQTADHVANTVFFELNADTGAIERRTCGMTTAIGDSTAPEFVVSPDGRTVAIAISAASSCGISDSGLYAMDVSGR